MKAAVLHAPNDLRIEEINQPHPGPGDVMMQVAYCGVCGSDFPRLQKGAAHYFPIVLGHEFSGTIVAVGSAVDPTLIGRQAACIPLIPNLDDPLCQQGHYSLGKGYGFIGSRQQGGFAEYVVMPQVNAVLLPDSIDLVAASFMEPLTVGLHAINIMGFVPGRATAVIGAGNIGLLLLQSLKALGAGSISVFDVDNEKLELARRLGADRTFNSQGSEGIEKSFLAATGGIGFPIVFETAGVPSAEIMALSLAAAKARVMFVGTPHVPLTLEPAQFEHLNRKELTVQGAWMNYSAPFPGWEWEFGAQLFAKNKIETKVLIDRIIPLSEANVIPELLGQKGVLKGKILIDCRT